MSTEGQLHPELSPKQRRELFKRGIDLFNRERFYDCHEAFEEIWRSTSPEPKNLFQGLIQIAVGFFHLLERRRPDVALRVLAKGRRRLETLPAEPVPTALEIPEPNSRHIRGLDLERLLTEVRQWEEILESWATTKSEQSPSKAHQEETTLPPLPRISVISPVDLA